MKPHKTNKIIRLTTIASVLSTLYFPTYAQAQTQEAAEEKKVLEVIEVTARKRSENLQEVPVAITALTAEDIEKQGILSIEDLSTNSPGFDVSNNDSGKTDRTNQVITIRGFTPSSAVDPTTAIFIDGVPVASPSALQSIGSPERVEILRGPQSAYFGRNTFAGAVNVVNKAPNDEWAGSVALSLGNYDQRRLRADVEGVLVDDILSFRLSAEHSEREGAFDNAAVPGQTLGDQQTDMASLYVVFKPLEELTFKLFAFKSKDDDGPAASALISSTTQVNPFTGETLITGQSNCTLNDVHPGICGSIPDKADPISAATVINDSQKALIAGNSLGLDDYGAVRELDHLHLVADWDVSDSLTLSSLTGYNKDQWAALNDIVHYPSAFPYAFFIERETKDFSQELRGTYVNDGPLSATFGVSYLEADIARHLTNAALSEVAPIAKQGSETLGGFFGINYELIEDLNLSLEGRLQKDELYSFDSLGNKITASSTNFLPRIILDYKFNDNTMGYVTFSKGVNPGNFNGNIPILPEYARDVAENLGINLVVEPEKVTNYELGIKGSAFDGMMNYSASAYYSIWSDQLNRISQVVFNPDTTVGGFTSVTGLANTGEVDLFGFELETNWMLTDDLRLNGTFGYTDSEIQDYINPLTTELTGDVGDDFKGKEQPMVSKYSANIGLQYDGVINDDYDYFTRADVSYKSGQWTNASNNLKTDDIVNVNLRAGVYIGDVEVTAYVKNLFDDDSYTSAQEYYTFFNFASRSSVIASLQQPRTLGVEVKWSFYE